MKTNIFSIIACSALIMAACSEKDLYDPNGSEKIAKNEYSRNFIKRYGNGVVNNNTWDYSEGSLLTRAGEITQYSCNPVKGLDFGFTESVNSKLVISSSAKKNTNIIDDIAANLPDGKKQTGMKAVLTAPNNGFTIYPISAQGAYTYDLFVKVGDNAPIKIFTKNWTDWSHAYYNNMGTTAVNRGTTNKPDYQITKRASMPGVYIEAPIGTPIQVYLDNIYNGDNRVTDQKVGTASGNAIILDDNGKIPAGIEDVKLVAGAVAKYIGIEDNIFNADGTGGGDQDFNDLVLAIVGNPYTPQPLVIEDGQYTVKTTAKKRYMIEDLGDTNDFDFNDVVVDVEDNTEIVHKTVTTNGVITSDEIVSTNSTQKATIRHLGGELPFVLTIGNTILPVHNGAQKLNEERLPDEDVEEVFEIEGWSAAKNNISIQVKNVKNDQEVFEITFPKKGEAPMIIATSVTKEWMPERVAIDWF